MKIFIYLFIYLFIFGGFFSKNKISFKLLYIKNEILFYFIYFWGFFFLIKSSLKKLV